MVESSVLFAMGFTLFITLFFPFILAWICYRRYGIALRPLMVGAGVFIVSQWLLRIPLLNWMMGQSWYAGLATQTVLFMGFLSLTAGLFEEVGRYLGFSFLLRDHRTWKAGLAFGIGHGGIEAILLVGTTYINNLIYSVSINAGTFDRLTEPLGEQAQVIKAQLTSIPASLFVQAGIERLLVMMIHIALSMLVLYAVVHRRRVFLLWAVLVHAMVNFPSVLLSQRGHTLLSQVYLGLLAAAAFVFIQRIRRSIDEVAERER